MIFSKTMKIIETHTAGNPTRHIVGGAPRMQGHTIAEKMQYMHDQHDWIRRITMQEPRGQSSMSGCLWTEPCSPEADMGVIYFDAADYMTMCGHSTIAVATLLVETGVVKMEEPVTTVKLDTPAGLVTAKVSVSNNKVKSVTFRNVPSFLYEAKTVHTQEFGDVYAEVAFGGMAYAIVDADKLHLEIRPDNGAALIRAGHIIHKACCEQIGFQHPEQPFMNHIHSVLFYAAPTKAGADSKEVVIVMPQEAGNATCIDRSPCGTGTSARIAAEYAMGRLPLNKPFGHQSIIETEFVGKIVQDCMVGKFHGGIPEITGAAYIISHIDFVFDPEDSIQDGFIVS